MKRSNPLLILPVEIKVREFNAKLLFSLIAAEAGYDVILGSQASLMHVAPRLDRGIYLDKSIAASKVSWFDRCRAMGDVPVAWDEEGLVFFSKQVYRDLRVDARALKKVAQFFAWGDVQAEAIREGYAQAGEKVVLTGNARFDILRPEWKAFHAPAAERLRRRYGRTILINTAFPFANHFRDEKTLMEALEGYPIAAAQPDFFPGWIEAQKQAFDTFVEMLPAVSRAFPGTTIVVRPHPSEKHDTWVHLAEKLDNVTVTAEGSVIEWILASEVLVHFNCTTAIEAFMLDVPAIAYRAVRPEPYEQYLPNALSLDAFDLDSLLALLKRVLAANGNYPPLREEPGRYDVAARHITALDGALASERIVEGLAEVPSPPVRERSVAERLRYVRNEAWPSVLRTFRRLTDAEAGYEHQKFPGVRLAEVRESARRFGAISGRFSGVSIRRCGPSCFEILAPGRTRGNL